MTAPPVEAHHVCVACLADNGLPYTARPKDE
jgi:hypothetical protein